MLASPTSYCVTAGDVATMTVVSASATANVQWQVSVDGGQTFNAIPGATSAAYTFTADPTQDGNEFEAAYTVAGSVVTTAPATFQVLSAPAIATQPTSQIVGTGNPATFTAVCGGDPAPSVQWLISTDGGQTFNAIAGATSPAYSFTTSAIKTATSTRPSSATAWAQPPVLR